MPEPKQCAVPNTIASLGLCTRGEDGQRHFRRRCVCEEEPNSQTPLPMRAESPPRLHRDFQTNRAKLRLTP